MNNTISIMELNNYQPLDSLKPDNLREISAKLQVTDLSEGDSVFKKGDRDDAHIFLHKGSVDLFKDGNKLKTIEAGTPEAKLALAHIIPRMFDAVASSDARIFKVNAEQLDLMLTWDQTGSFKVEELEEDDDDDWMSKLLHTDAFHRIPPANIQAIFTSLEDIHVKKGDTIIRQDDPGDYFYIIKQGRCRVLRKMPGQDKEIRLADLSMGDTFGEEALISDNTRNASIVMLEDGLLSRLSKQQFLELLNEPMLHKDDYTNASFKVKNGEAVWLDVRLPGEFSAAHIKDAENVPLISLRMKVSTLDKFKNYIVYCDTERRSSAASYLLSERGFKSSVLINGMKDIPSDDLEGESLGNI